MKQFKKNVLVVTLSMLSSAALHAQSNTTAEIEQLRNEINALKQMLQQNTQQQQQQAVLMSIAQQLYQLSPDIALDPPDGLYLRLCQILRLYQGLAGYWQAIQTALSALPYRYSYATGNTPLAAKCLARQQLNLISSDSDAMLAQLKRSPLRFTELNPEIQQQLQRLGLQQLGQVMALSQAELGRRFEHSLLSYLGRLRGEFYHALDYVQPQQGFSSTLELLYDISDTAVLNTPLKLLLQQLELQLQRADALCHQLLLEIRFRAQKPLTVVISSAQGEYRAAQWLRLCQLQLETVRLTEPASGIKLDVPRFAPQRHLVDFFGKRDLVVEQFLFRAEIIVVIRRGLDLADQRLDGRA